MGDNDMSAANELVSLIRQLVGEELANKDRSDTCKIVAINNDGTYDAVIVPDEQVTLKRVKSLSPEKLRVGDHVYIYKFQNKLNNVIILTKIGPDVSESKYLTSESLEKTAFAQSVGEGGSNSDDFPVIAVTTLTLTHANFNQDHDAYLNVKIVSGTVQVGDELCLCYRKKSKRRQDDKRKSKLHTAVKVVITNPNERVYKIPIKASNIMAYKDYKWHPGGDTSYTAAKPTYNTGPTLRYVKLRRVFYRRSRTQCSNIEVVKFNYSHSREKLSLY